MTGEVVVGKEQVVERQQITDTVREVEVDIDAVSYQQARAGFVEHFTQQQAVHQQAG